MIVIPPIVTGLAPRLAGKRKKENATASAVFSDMLDRAERAGASPPASAALPLANPLLMAQELPINPEKQAVTQGKDQLDALERLRDALLAGTLSEAAIRTLEQSVERQRVAVNDPGLREILDDIALRVAVELAKLERARR